MSHEPKHVLLWSTEGNSDKLYELWLKPDGKDDSQDDDWSVYYANNRRGGPMVPKVKTRNLSWEQANKLYEDTMKSKMNGDSHYTIVTQDGTDTEYTPAVREEVDTGIRPYLLNDIYVAEQHLRDDDWLMQIKKNGERRFFVDTGHETYGINRRGMRVPVPSMWYSEVPCILDGEAIGDKLYAFDILEWEGQDLRPWSLNQRLVVLHQLKVGGGIEKVETFRGFHAKNIALSEAIKNQEEGVVFKHKQALYIPGKLSSGGMYLKYKFYKTASVVVSAHNVARSVGMETVDGVPLGNVAIPACYDVPAVGSVIEVRYLFALEGGSLNQPVYQGLRMDILPEECTLDQIKFLAKER